MMVDKAVDVSLSLETEELKVQEHVRAIVGSIEHASTREDLLRRMEEWLKVLQTELRADKGLAELSVPGLGNDRARGS